MALPALSPDIDRPGIKCGLSRFYSVTSPQGTGIVRTYEETRTAKAPCLQAPEANLERAQVGGLEDVTQAMLSLQVVRYVKQVRQCM